MTRLEEFLKTAFPDVEPALARDAAAALAGRGPETPDPHVEDLMQQVEDLKDANGRLSNEIIRHKDGVRMATRAGLDVLGERARQRRMEGYDDEHDDAHEGFALTSAAVAYASDARLRGTSGRGFDDVPPIDWPWTPGDWKPKDVRRNLVVAAALIIAELERLDRSTGR